MPTLLLRALLLGALLCGTVGCRSLRTNRHTRSLAAARQLSLRGADHLQQQNYQDAGPLFSDALKHSPVDERAHWGIAKVFWTEGDRQRATQHMAKAAELSGNNPELLVQLGEMYLSEGDLARAEVQADLALARDRQHADAWALKGEVLRAGEHLEDALDCYQRALIHRPVNPTARIALADIYHELGRPQRALATLDQLADDQPTEQIPARAWMLKGQALASLGQQVQAQDCLRHAVACASESDVDVLLKLAEIQYRSGDLGEARVCLGRVLNHSPNNPIALNFRNVLDQSFDNIAEQPLIPGMQAGWQTPVGPP